VCCVLCVVYVNICACVCACMCVNVLNFLRAVYVNECVNV